MSFVVRGLLGMASVAIPTLAQAQSAPAAPPTAARSAPLRVFMRNEGGPLTFSARPESPPASPAWCISPCDLRLPAGDYELKLNNVSVGDALKLRQPGTLRGEYESRQGTRAAAWLALNMGGLIGGVFITVGIAGGGNTAFAVGGGVLAGATAIFFITYRADRATVSFTPDPPVDTRGMPEPAGTSGARQAAFDRAPLGLGSTPRGLGFRIAF